MAIKRNLVKKTPRPWYLQDWFIILMLVFVVPVGIFLMWYSSGWKRDTKIIVTALSIGLFFTALVGSSKAAPTLSIESPANDLIRTDSATFHVSGKITGANSKTVLTANDRALSITNGKFSGTIALKEGSNTIIFKAKKGDKYTEKKAQIYRLTAAEVAARQAALAKQAADKAAADKAAADQAAAEEARRNAPKTTFGDGTYLVNKDIAPGRYRTEGSSSCYYERLRDTSGEFSAIITNDNPQGPAVVTIAASDAAFTSKRCGIWSAI